MTAHRKSKIWINGRFLTRPPTGVDRFAIELVKSIDRLLAMGDPSVAHLNFTLLHPDDIYTELPLAHVPVAHVAGKGLLWEQVAYRWAAKGGLLLNLCNSSPLLEGRNITVIHDAATVTMPQSYSTAFRAWYSMLIRSALWCSKSIFTVSNFSKREISRHYGSMSAIDVIPEGCDHLAHVQPDFSVLEKHQLASKRFILTVGSNAPHKNFAAVTQAIAQLGDYPFDFAIAGGVNDRIFQGSGLLAGAKRLGFVSDSELVALYKSASAFIFPSLYEGFGLPPVEAMHFGCPVLCSSAASLPEVCGSAALYFDPRNPSDLAEKLLQLESDPALLPRLGQAALQHSKTLTWENAARIFCTQLQNA